MLPAQLHYLTTWNRFAVEWLGSTSFWACGIAAALLFGQVVDAPDRIPHWRLAWAMLRSAAPLDGPPDPAGGTPAGQRRLLAVVGLLRTGLLFGTALFLLLHAFDARYRGFALALYVLPMATMLSCWLTRQRLPADAVEERWLGLIILAATPFMLMPEWPDNHQALLLAAMVLPIGLYPLLARRPDGD